MNAVDVYIENNENVKTQLYENNNGIENEEYCLEKALYAISNNKDEECEKWFQKSIDINSLQIKATYRDLDGVISQCLSKEFSIHIQPKPTTSQQAASTRP